MPTISRGAAHLHYLDEGQGPPVLLLHAFPLQSELFRPQLEALKERFRFLVPDTRGFGKSAPGGGPASMTEIAEDALAVLDEAGVTAAVVGGVSMGGYATLALLQLDPSRVRGLMLIDTQATADDEAGKVRREETAQALETQGVQVLVDALLPKLLGPAAPAPLRAQVEAMIRDTPAQAAADATRAMARRADTRPALSRFAGPTLVVVGDQDPITPPAKAQELAGLVPSAELVTIPGAGHLSNLEAPAQVNIALERFLTRVHAGG
jgi:pimeloyl-ACP methyl ester carboxylesterase